MFARPEVPKQRPMWLTPIDGGLRRLDVEDIGDLRFLWHAYEAAVGFKAAGLEYVPQGSRGSFSHPLVELHALRAIGRARKVTKILKGIADLHRVVLFQVYGGQRHRQEFATMSDLAGIVAYTPEAERRAQKLETSPVEAIRLGLKGPESAVFVASMRNAGERLLCRAAEDYRRAKAATRCTSPRS